MDELNTLRKELADLRQEVKTLKRARWISPGSIGLALLALVAFAVAAPKQDQDPKPPTRMPVQRVQEMVCKSIRIVNDADQTMLQLGSDKDGGMLVIYGADGKKRFFAAVEHNAGFTDWFDAAGGRRATVFVGDQGNAEFRLTDKFDHAAVALRQTSTGGSLKLNGADGSERVAAGSDSGGFVDIFDSFGSRRASLYLNEQNTAQFKLLSTDKVARFLLTGDADSGKAIAYGVDGKSKGIFPAPGASD